MTWDLENGLLKAIDIKLEVWKSSENQEEHHYFLMDKPSGHELYTYAFGINPKLFDPESVRKILEMLDVTTCPK